jgi:hypothetical protein
MHAAPRNRLGGCADKKPGKRLSPTSRSTIPGDTGGLRADSASSKSIPGARATRTSSTPTASSSTSTPTNPSPGPPSPPPQPMSARASANSASPASSKPPAAKASTSSPHRAQITLAQSQRLRPQLRPRHGARQPRALPHQDDQVRPHRPHLPRLPPQRARRHRRRPYSPRARLGTHVSLPLPWAALKEPRLPVFSVTGFPEWKDRLRSDPWKSLPTTLQRLDTAKFDAL